jgi:hypothetical protein
MTREKTPPKKTQGHRGCSSKRITRIVEKLREVRRLSGKRLRNAINEEMRHEGISPNDYPHVSQLVMKQLIK